jgi:hypothetical protein
MCSVAAAVAILLAAGTVRAHHSFAAVFDLSKKFTVSGTLTKIDWRNPHIEIFVLVIGERGERESWVIEADSPGVFRSRNVNKGDFEKAVGQTVTVEAVRARDGSLYGLMQQITFPDGSSVRLPELQRLTGAA